jgi:protein-disulfide isomerase
MERFQADLLEDTFRKQIEIDYQTALFDEHITGTPTLYINDARYTQLTDLDTILIAIKEADASGRINLTAPKRGLKRMLDGLRHRADQ